MKLVKVCMNAWQSKLFHKTFSFERYNVKFEFKYSFSTKPLDLSFIEFQPDKFANKSPIIILHGFLGSKQNWRGLAKAIAQRSNRKIYALDARNHGDSPHSDYFSYKLMCEDVKCFMKSKLLTSAVLVGHSMGGRTAMKLALEEENFVEKLVIVDVSPTKLPESTGLIPAYMSAMKESLAAVRGLGIVQARKVIDTYLAQSIPEAPIRHFLLTNLTQNDKEIVWKANIDALQKTFLPEICYFSDFVGCYTKETLFISGEESPYVKNEDHPLIKKLFPKAEFISIAGAGHWVHSEKPSEFLDALCNFL